MFANLVSKKYLIKNVNIINFEWFGHFFTFYLPLFTHSLSFCDLWLHLFCQINFFPFGSVQTPCLLWILTHPYMIGFFVIYDAHIFNLLYNFADSVFLASYKWHFNNLWAWVFLGTIGNWDVIPEKNRF